MSALTTDRIAGSEKSLQAFDNFECGRGQDFHVGLSLTEPVSASEIKGWPEKNFGLRPVQKSQRTFMYRAVYVDQPHTVQHLDAVGVAGGPISLCSFKRSDRVTTFKATRGVGGDFSPHQLKCKLAGHHPGIAEKLIIDRLVLISIEYPTPVSRLDNAARLKAKRRKMEEFGHNRLSVSTTGLTASAGFARRDGGFRG